MVEYAIVSGGSLNLREEKSVNSTRLTSIPNNTRIAVISNENEWCKIVYNSYTGYVLTKYLKFESGGDDNNVLITISRDDALALYEALKLSLEK